MTAAGRSARRLLSLMLRTTALVVVSATGLAAQADPPVVSPPSATVPDAPPPPPADQTGFRFHGYLRSGFGVDGSGKGQQPFIAPLAGSKYRLGNEAETYLETTFDFGTTSDGPDPAYFDTRVTLAYVLPTSQTSTFATTFSLREAYALARNSFEASFVDADARAAMTVRLDRLFGRFV